MAPTRKSKKSVVPRAGILSAKRQSITLHDDFCLSGKARGDKSSGAIRYDQKNLVQFVMQNQPNKLLQQVELCDEGGDPLFLLRDITIEEVNAIDWLPIIDGDNQAVV